MRIAGRTTEMDDFCFLEDAPRRDEGGLFHRLATALTELLTRRPLLVVSIIAPSTALALAWHLYRLEAAAITASLPGVSATIDVLIGAMVAVVAILAFLTGRLSYSLAETEEWMGKASVVRARLKQLAIDKRDTEHALKQANERLAGTAATLEQWAADLETANARLHDLNNLKTKFVSEAGHELRAPVTAIVSAAKIIVRHHATKPDVVDRFGSTIVVEGERLTRLLNDLLDLTKIEAGCIEWKESDVDAGDLVGQAILSVEPLAVEEHISVTAEAPLDLPTLSVDRDRVSQVLTNLLHNAIKYTPKAGNITVRVSCNEREFVFAVKDSGPGIEDDDLARVFDRFVQVRTVDNDSQAVDHETAVASTGLGLCISREIVEHYGGRIWVDSKPGKGSTFSFTIPTGPKAAEAGAETPSSGKTSVIAPVRVLALLESDVLADRAVAVSPTTGIECRACSSIAELTTSLSSYMPDAVLVSASLIPEFSQALLDAVQAHGISELLVHAPDGRIRSRSVRDSSVIAVRRLRYHVSPGSTVLVVEDDERYSQIVEFELRHAGYGVLRAHDGHEALTMIANEQPDAVILDILMPHVDGLTVLEEMARNDTKIPVLVVTSMSDDDVGETATSLGAVEVLRKDGVGLTTSAPVFVRVQRTLAPLLGDHSDYEANAEDSESPLPS
jgi:signal transduction histidine kinase/CheY-like chemotaxis protein